MPTIDTHLLAGVKPRVKILQHALSNPSTVSPSTLFMLLMQVFHRAGDITDPAALHASGNGVWQGVHDLITATAGGDEALRRRCHTFTAKAKERMQSNLSTARALNLTIGEYPQSATGDDCGAILSKMADRLPPELHLVIIKMVCQDYRSKGTFNSRGNTITTTCYERWQVKTYAAGTPQPDVLPPNGHEPTIPLSMMFGTLYAFGTKFQDGGVYHVTREFFNQRFAFDSFQSLYRFLEPYGVVDDLGEKRVVSRATLLCNFTVTTHVRNKTNKRICPSGGEFDVFLTLAEMRKECIFPFEWQLFTNKSSLQPGCVYVNESEGMVYIYLQLESTQSRMEPTSSASKAWKAAHIASAGKVHSLIEYVGSSFIWQHDFNKDGAKMAGAQAMIDGHIENIFIAAVPVHRCKPLVAGNKYIFKVGPGMTGGREWTQTRGGRGSGQWQYGEDFWCDDESTRSPHAETESDLPGEEDPPAVGPA